VREAPCNHCLRKKVTNDFNCHDEPEYCQLYPAYRKTQEAGNLARRIENASKALTVESIRRHK